MVLWGGLGGSEYVESKLKERYVSASPGTRHEFAKNMAMLSLIQM